MDCLNKLFINVLSDLNFYQGLAQYMISVYIQNGLNHK